MNEEIQADSPAEDAEAAVIAQEIAAKRGRKPKAKPETPTVYAPAPVYTQPKAKTFPVRLVRNYRPLNPFTIDGAEPSPEQAVKAFAGMSIEVDVEEAKDIIARGIAIRNDPIG